MQTLSKSSKSESRHRKHADSRALSPPEIYPDNYARFKLAAVLAVPAVALHYTPAQYVARGITFGFGAVFWGRKWIRIGIRKIIKWYPHWKQIIDPRK